MKRFKKILKITGITLAVLVALLAAAPFLFKGKIVQAIKNTANQSLNAKLDFDPDISLSFLRSFPNVSLSINKLSIVGKDSFNGDTLVYLPKLQLTLDVMSVVKGEQIGVKRVALNQPTINIETLRSGKANWDILKSDSTATDTSSGAAFKMALHSFTIEDGHLIYDDRSLDFYTELSHFNHSSKGDFTADQFTMETHTETPSLILGYGGVNWLYKIKTVVDANIGMDMNAFKFTYEKGTATLNDLTVESNGMVDLNDDDIDMDISFAALENSFKNFLSLVPGIYSESFKDVTASGEMGFAGTMKGKMTDDKMPAINVGLNIKNGAFQYPGLAYKADNIFLNLNYSNPDGIPDNSVVNIDRFMVRMAGDVFNMKLLLKTPVSDPFIDANLKGKLDLSKIAGLIPLEKGSKIGGLIDADVSAKGNYSAASSQNFSKLDAKGTLKIQDLLYQSPTDKEPYKIDNLALNFTPQKVDVNACKGNIGKNDFDVTGSVENLLGYMFADETITGNVAFKSNYLNINNLMGDDNDTQDPKPEDTAQLTIVELPSNIDMKLNTDVKKLVYDNYVLTNLSGTAHMHDAQIDMKDLKANILGGSIALNGTYDSKNIKNPFTTLDTKVEQLNLGQSFGYFSMLSKFAPIAQFVDGMFNASIDMNSILNEHMQPNYASMNVNGMVSFTDAAVKNLDIMKQIGKQLNIKWLENFQLKNQQVKFQIKEGIFTLLDSLTLPLGNGATMKLAGQTKLDQTVSYGGWIKIPRALMGQGNKVLDGWISQASSKGWNLQVEDMIPVDLSVTGTFLKPVVSVSLKGFAQSAAKNIKDQGTQIAKDEANKKLQEALAKAQVQADKVKAEGAKRAEQVRAEGKQAAQKVRNETANASDVIRKQGDAAYDKAMAETETAAKAAEDKILVPSLKKAAGDRVRAEGKKKAEATKSEFYKRASQTDEAGNKKALQIETEANNRANDIESKANDEADKIMKDAENKAKI